MMICVIVSVSLASNLGYMMLFVRHLSTDATTILLALRLLAELVAQRIMKAFQSFVSQITHQITSVHIQINE